MQRGREIIEIVRKYVRNIAEGNYCKHEQRKKKENEWGKEEYNDKVKEEKTSVTCAPVRNMEEGSCCKERCTHKKMRRERGAKEICIDI